MLNYKMTNHNDYLQLARYLHLELFKPHSFIAVVFVTLTMLSMV